MQHVMYEIPGMKDVRKCIVTEDVVLKHSDPVLIKEDGTKE